jgi:hypothetical protein
MTLITETAIAPLEAEGRLFNPVFKGALPSPGLFGFRGELALKFSPQLADEARPPEILAEQLMLVAEAGKPTIPFMCCYLLSFEYLKPLVEVLGDALAADGKYFVFCNNIDLTERYQVPYGGATFNVLPIDEATAWNELLELLYLERGDLKRLDTGSKLDVVYRKAMEWSDTFSGISYDEGLQRMGPVRNPNENRPV